MSSSSSSSSTPFVVVLVIGLAVSYLVLVVRFVCLVLFARLSRAARLSSISAVHTVTFVTPIPSYLSVTGAVGRSLEMPPAATPAGLISSPMSASVPEFSAHAIVVPTSYNVPASPGSPVSISSRGCFPWPAPIVVLFWGVLQTALDEVDDREPANTSVLEVESWDPGDAEEREVEVFKFNGENAG